MILRKFRVPAIATLLAFAAVALVVFEATPLTAQEVVQNEGSAYRAWYEAVQAKDVAKAAAAGRDYLAKYPTGQYASAIQTWLLPAEYELAVKEKRTADVIKFGRQLLAKDPENLALVNQIVLTIRNNELLVSPANYEHTADAVELANKAISSIEAGKTPAGAANFDKNATLALLTQVLAVTEAKSGNVEQAIKLYDRSTSLAPGNGPIAGRNLLAVYTLREASYSEAAKAYKAVTATATTPAAPGAAEPKPEVKAAQDRLTQETDGLIDAAAAFVAFAKLRNLAPATRDRVNQTLEALYKSRHPEDASLAGLQKLLQDKEASFGASAAPAAPAAPAPPGA